MNYITKDSGKREEFNTGSKRDASEGKHRFDLIWVGMLIRLAALMARGAAKYGEHNWMKGQPISRYWESLLRHAYAWKNGDDPNEDHLAAIIFNVMGIMYTVTMCKVNMLPIELLKMEDGKWFDCQDTIYQDNPDIAEEVVANVFSPIRELFKYMLSNHYHSTVKVEYIRVGKDYPEFFKVDNRWSILENDFSDKAKNRWAVIQNLYDNPNSTWRELKGDTPLTRLELDRLIDDLHNCGLINDKSNKSASHVYYLTLDN